jgi:hypothetical protein
MTTKQIIARRLEEQIIARRLTDDEFWEYAASAKIERYNGRMVLKSSGIELFVGVKEFPESVKALKERPEEHWNSVYGDE